VPPARILGIATLVALSACGSRTGFDQASPASPDASTFADAGVDATSLVTCHPGDPPFDVVGNGEGIVQLVVVGDTIYFSTQLQTQSNASIWTVSSDGGAPSPTGIGDVIGAFTSDGESIFWAKRLSAIASSVRARSVSGGPARDVVANAGDMVTGLLADADSVYVGVYEGSASSGLVFRIDKRDTTSTPVRLDEARSTHGPLVAQDADAVYSFDVTALKRYAKRGAVSETTVVSYGNGTVSSATSDGRHYALAKWLGGVGHVLVAPVSGGDPVTLATTAAQPSDVVIDGDDVYWFESSALHKSSISRPSVVTLASGLSNAHGLVVGTTCAFFLQGGQIITRVAK